uniref:Uncharacterized protein n=1 Tax=Glossina brevipalpis TaxID=37001 RepID=A0A1A9WLF8_9MUSC
MYINQQQLEPEQQFVGFTLICINITNVACCLLLYLLPLITILRYLQLLLRVTNCTDGMAQANLYQRCLNNLTSRKVCLNSFRVSSVMLCTNGNASRQKKEQLFVFAENA